MKFDVIIFNSPYQKTRENGTKDTTYYIGFQKKAIEWLNTGGYFSSVMPNAFISPYTKIAKEIKNIIPKFVIPCANGYFEKNGNPVWTEVGVLMGIKSGQEIGSFDDCSFEYGKSVSIGNLGRLETTIRESSKTGEIGRSIARKIFYREGKKIIPVNNKSDLRSQNFVSVSIVYKRYSPNKEKGGDFTLNAYSNSEDLHEKKNFFECDIDSGERANTLRWLLSESLLMRFINHYFSMSPFITGSPFVRGLLTYPSESIVIHDEESVFKDYGISKKEICKIKEWLN